MVEPPGRRKRRRAGTDDQQQQERCPKDVLREQLSSYLLTIDDGLLLEDILLKESVELLCINKYRDRWVPLEELRLAITLSHFRLGKSIVVDIAMLSRALIGERRTAGKLKLCFGINVDDTAANPYQLRVRRERVERIDDRVTAYSICAGTVAQDVDSGGNSLLDPRDEEHVRRHKKLRSSLDDACTRMRSSTSAQTDNLVSTVAGTQTDDVVTPEDDAAEEDEGREPAESTTVTSWSDADATREDSSTSPCPRDPVQQAMASTVDSEKLVVCVGMLEFAGRDQWKPLLEKGIRSMLEDVLSLPSKITSLDPFARETAMGYIQRSFIMHRIPAPTDSLVVPSALSNCAFIIRPSLCQIKIPQSALCKGGLCTVCYDQATRNRFCKVLSEEREAMVRHSQPPKPQTRLDHVTKVSGWSRVTIDHQRDQLRAKDIEIRRLELENLGLKRKGEIVCDDRASTEKVIEAILLADEHARKALKDDEAALIEWTAHATNAARHKLKYGSMKGYKHHPSVLRFAISILEQVGGEVYDKIAEMFKLPTRRHLQERRAVIRKAVGCGDGIFYAPLELVMEQIRRHLGVAEFDDAIARWVLAYDSMTLREGIWYTRGNVIAGIDKVEDFDVVSALFKEHAAKQQVENAEYVPDNNKLIGDDELKAKHHFVVYATSDQK